MSWLQPMSWWALTAVAVPVLIHLLARAPARRFLFPSLRFLRPMQQAALRRRLLSDLPLLAVRGLIIVAATAALAGPVFVSDGRRASWNQRTARAIVVPNNAGVAAARVAAQEASTGFVAATFDAAALPDALRDATEWLRKQPPAAREIVVVGDLREGTLGSRDVAAIPPFIGIRFLPVTPDSDEPKTGWRSIAEDPAGHPAVSEMEVTADERRTHVRYRRAGELIPTALRIVAGRDDQDYAQALLRAVQRHGLLIAAGDDRRLTIAFSGAAVPELQRATTPGEMWMRRALEQNPEVRGGQVDRALVVRADMRVTDARAAGIVARLAETAFDASFDGIEPRRIGAAMLARWSRPPGSSPDHVLPADEGDRRWFWAAALVLLALEQVLRRTRRAARFATRPEDQPADEDARVA